MSVVLHHRAEFEEILKTYEPSEESVRFIGSRPLVILLGISGGGRNTIINHLIDTGRYHFIVSDTTRPPKVRDGELEQNGMQYFFRTEEEVLQDLKQGEFLEAELIHNQQVSGTSIRELKRAYESGKIPINEVDIAGTVNILRAKPDTSMFFIVPPSYDIWLDRLHAREDMSAQELENRTRTAVEVLKTGIESDHFSFVINDSSLDSAHMLDAQVTSGKVDHDHNEEAREIARGILAELVEHTH